MPELEPIPDQTELEEDEPSATPPQGPTQDEDEEDWDSPLVRIHLTAEEEASIDADLDAY